jgi:hypothetical protein
MEGRTRMKIRMKMRNERRKYDKQRRQQEEQQQQQCQFGGLLQCFAFLSSPSPLALQC